MSKDRLYHYAIARYVPDPVRNEPRNIGIVLFDENLEDYRVQFTTNFKSKLGHLLWDSDRELIAEYVKYFQQLAPSTKESILSTLSQATGKFQFSDVRAVVATNADAEFNFLYATFVEDSVIHQVRKHRLKTTLKEAFAERHLLGVNKLEVNREIQVGDLTFKFDFTFENGKLHTIEAVDLSVQTPAERKAQTYESALKFEKIIHDRGANKVNPITVIQKPKILDIQSKELLKVLENTSTVYNLSNGQREKFFSDMQQIVG